MVTTPRRKGLFQLLPPSFPKQPADGALVPAILLPILGALSAPHMACCLL